MLKRRIIPCLDVNAGRVVKGVRFQNLTDAGDPVELALHYQQQGADEIVFLDVSATREDRIATLDTVDKVRRGLTIPLTVGGGVNSTEDARRLLNSGADKVSINSAAVKEPGLVDQMASMFGAQCTVIAIDAKERADVESEQMEWQVMTRSGTRAESLDVVEWAKEVEQRGAGEILLTSFDRDGTRGGYDLGLLKAVADAVDLPTIASGGADSVEHMVEAFEHGAHAVLAASIFHNGNLTVEEVKQQLDREGIPVRMAETAS